VIEASEVAQAVEQQISVRAGHVRILGQPMAFLAEYVSILAGRWALSINEVIDHTTRFYFHSSFLCPILITNYCVNQLIVINAPKSEINPKKRP
jgi:hypothetical protein